MSVYDSLRGTTESTFQIEKNGPQLKNNVGAIEAKNSGDTAFANLSYADPTADDHGATKRYVDAEVASVIAAPPTYIRPDLEYISASEVGVMANGAIANQTMVYLPSGLRTVTEAIGTGTGTLRRFLITRTANFSSDGTAASGLRSGLAEAANTWYALYAVGIGSGSTQFIISGDDIIPSPANVATLNTRYGSGNWIYLGLIRNGNGAALTLDILRFDTNGNLTKFFAQTSSVITSGIQLDRVIGLATPAQYTVTIGMGITDLPESIKIIQIEGISGPGGAGQYVYVGGYQSPPPSTLFYIMEKSSPGPSTYYKIHDFVQSNVGNTYLCYSAPAIPSNSIIGLIGFYDKYLA